MGRVLTVLIVVALAGAGAYAALRDPTPKPGFVPEDSASRALLLSGSRLTRLDFESGGTRRIGRSPTKDVHASHVGSWLAYVVSGGMPAEPDADFVAAPVMRLIDIESDAKVDIGPGFNPLWHPSEPKLAYLRPIVERHCSGESCEGLFEVVVFDAAEGQKTVVAEAGRYNLLAWSGQRVLVADESDLSVTFSLGADHSTARLDLAPSELWGASPDGRFVLRSVSSAVTLIDLEGDRDTDIAIGKGVLADGAWSPDSKRIAAAALNQSRTKGKVVVIETATGDTEEVTEEVTGILDVTWGPDARQFGFLTFAGASNRVVLNLCSATDEAPACEVVSRPLRRTILLRFE